MKTIQYLPEKYNEIMRLMFVKEIRFYLPIQELNVLLEPLRDPNEENESDDDESDAITREEIFGTSSSSEVHETSDDDEQSESDDKFDSNDSSYLSNESVHLQDF
jgi:hypothetical protein